MCKEKHLVKKLWSHHVPVNLLRHYKGEEHPRLSMSGSGFLLNVGEKSELRLITADHVIRPDLHNLTAEIITDNHYVAVGSANPADMGDFVTGSLIWRDYIGDIASLSLNKDIVYKQVRHKRVAAKPVALADVNPRVGDTIFICGHHGVNSNSCEKHGTTHSRLIIKRGTITDVGNDRIRADVLPSPTEELNNLKGVSGSCLFNSDCQLIGVVVNQRLDTEGLPNRAVSAQRIHQFLDEIENGQ